MHIVEERVAVRCLALLLAASLAGCGSGGHAAATRTPSPLPTAGRGGPAGAEAVVFRAADGVGLRGRWFGKGDGPAVVMAHMGNQENNEADWYGLARRLVREGYRVLTYNRRGVCSGDGAYDCSAGTDDDRSESWNDVVGAVRFASSRGASRFAVIGSSIGASSCLYAAETGRIHPAALISLAGVNYTAAFSFDRGELRKLEGAKLFVSGDNDPFNAGRTAREWYGWARGTKRLAILESGRHGTDMLASTQPTHRPLTRLIVRFLEKSLPAT
jgi:alpha/beta superfamily hydrolase